MILEEETFTEFGYYPSALAPKSAKRILVTCDSCGKVRAIRKFAYHSLCQSCANKGENHPMYGKHHSEEAKKKISIANKGKHVSEETRKKIGEASKGKHHSEEAKQKMRDAHRGKELTQEHKEKISKTLKTKPHYLRGKHLNEETKRKISGTLKGNKLSEETRKKISEANKGERNYFFGKHHTSDTRKRMSESWNYDRHFSEKTRARLSESAIKLWQDTEYIKKVMAGLNIKPNKLEQKVNEIIQKNFPHEWKYNGDFSQGVVLAGLVPDFINVNGRKEVIEVFGDIYHDESELLKRFGSKLSWKRTEFGCKAVYSQVGYKCIILWEHELKRHAEEFVLDKLGMINNV